MEVNRLPELIAAFESRAYPGNFAIPEPRDDNYTFAGEIPWSRRFASDLRDASGEARPDRREAFEYHDGIRWRRGIPVEVPVCEFAWEGYHSELNQVSGVTVLAPALCERFHLSNRQGQWDLFDATGNVATVYREFRGSHDTFASRLAYVRRDLLAEYLRGTGQALVRIVWGEREFHYRTALGLTDMLGDLRSEYRHVHRRISTWTP